MQAKPDKKEEPFITVKIPIGLLREKVVRNLVDYLECIEILEKSDPDREALEAILKEIETNRRKKVKEVLSCRLS